MHQLCFDSTNKGGTRFILDKAKDEVSPPPEVCYQLASVPRVVELLG